MRTTLLLSLGTKNPGRGRKDEDVRARKTRGRGGCEDEDARMRRTREEDATPSVLSKYLTTGILYSKNDGSHLDLGLRRDCKLTGRVR